MAGQYLGRKIKEQGSHAAKQLIISVFVIGVIFMIPCLLFNRQLLTLCFGHIEEGVMYHARRYFYVTAVSFPFIAVYNGAAAYSGLWEAQISMVNSFIMNIINVIEMPY